MTAYKPFVDAKAIEHLDFPLVCQAHPHETGPDGEWEEVEPPCTATAQFFVTSHSPRQGCVTDTRLLCKRHLHWLFLDVPATGRKCSICGANRLHSVVPL